jgi:hypothetical protein
LYIAVTVVGATSGAFTTLWKMGLLSSGVLQHHGPEEGNPQELTQIYTIIALSRAF